jgi:hypothetical protein
VTQVGWKSTLSLLNAMADTTQKAHAETDVRRRDSASSAAALLALEAENAALRAEVAELKEHMVVLWEEGERLGRQQRDGQTCAQLHPIETDRRRHAPALRLLSDPFCEM